MADLELFVNTKDEQSDPNSRGVYLTPGLAEIMPDPLAVANEVDSAYQRDPHSYVDSLYGSIRELEGFGDAEHPVKYSLFYDATSSQANRLTVVFAPLNDCEPQSDSLTFLNYLQNPEPSDEDKQAAQPNSHRRAIKTANLHEALKAMDLAQPVAVIYGPISSSIFEAGDQQKIAAGFTDPYGKVMQQVVKQAQNEIHGPGSETQFTDIDVYSPGMGHIGAGATQHSLGFEVPYRVSSLTVPNLVTDVHTFIKPEVLAKWPDRLKLFMGYSLFQHLGVKAEKGLKMPRDIIRETVTSSTADKAGSEKDMRKRQMNAMLDFKTLAAMMRSQPLGDYILRAMNIGGTQVVIPLATGAKLTRATAQRFDFDHRRLERIDIRSGIEGGYADMMTNEFDRLDYTLAIRGTQRALATS